jgi:hypothetical protein
MADAELNGIKVTRAKYNLYLATCYYWRKKLAVYGEEVLSYQVVKNHVSLIKRLEKENAALWVLG